jgi:hypothetical protein
MKFYETTADEYISSIEKYNLHDELIPLYNHFPKSIKQFENMIVYGPVGSGKYSQVLYFLKKYRPSELKYEKKMTVQSEKNAYTFHISDIHYEIDMSFLGCNSKNLWHDIFFQIVDIISVKQEKIGIILCKNFHMIHSELLEIFYSYIQQFNTSHMNIEVKFILLSEHISFIPSNILNSCLVVNISKPVKQKILQMVENHRKKPDLNPEKSFLKRITNQCSRMTEKNREIVDEIDTNTLMNIKEIQSFSLLDTTEEIPKDIFNIICDQIIKEIECSENIHFTNFRDSLYDILIYNLDIAECVWYILTHFIMNDQLNQKDISDIMQKTFTFLKYYNNNYRPIYHLESIMFYLITKIKKYGGGIGIDIGECKNDKKKGNRIVRHK